MAAHRRLPPPQTEDGGDESWALRADFFCSANGVNDTTILEATADVWVSAPARGELQVRACRWMRPGAGRRSAMVR